ncbi:MAG: hypothetical protein HQL19_02130 [Candidatus Omnitrophica bacterium]|nr:hypothetical protein [Candidatus Omnitrophota bacterium]
MAEVRNNFNEWIATKLADALATMVMFFGVTFLTLSILFFQTPKTPLEWVQYIIQTFFQGVALPVLAFVAKIEGARQQKLLQETHDVVMREMKEIKGMMAELHAIEVEEKKIEAALEKGLKK